MAITQTGAIYKAFSFDNVSSRTFGVYITSEAVYNAPERDVEMISIPGRNGAFALDNGRFENIEVKYPAGIFADTETDFAQAVSDLRNYLCSKKGYFRLTDEYNPNEYRLAVYKSGLEVSPVQAKAGEFEIIFECKPQRFLTSGETEVTVSRNSTLTNPTLFGARPLLKVGGYGAITINSDTITVKNVPLGEIKLSDATDAYTSLSVSLDTANLNNGDPIYSNTTSLPRIEIKIRVNTKKTTSMSVANKTNCNETIVKSSNTLYVMTVTPTNIEYAKGTSSSAVCTAGLSLTIGTGGEAVQGSMTATITTAYNATNGTISTSLAWNQVISEVDVSKPDSVHIYYPAFMGDSSVTVLPSPMYIDLDVGEAYGTVNGVMTSFNNTTQLPAILPELKPGANTITYANTVTSLKVIPRWWKI